jgi:glycosyltransferase involved in cell wall biosynthesis
MSLYRPVGRWALLRADDVVAVSDWEREQLRNDLGIDATIIPNGIDIERYRDVEPSKREQPYLLTVGRLEEYKGVQHVIRALPDLPEYDLLVAGSGPYRKELEQIAIQQGVEDRVRFLGYVDDDDLPSLYAGADTYVTMSEFESFGITVGEALASGTPCIVLRRGALVDWETYGGVVGINSPDTESIYQAIRTVCSLDVPVDGIPVWDSHVEKLLNIY